MTGIPLAGSRGARQSTSSIIAWWRRRARAEPGLKQTVLALGHLPAGAGEEPSSIRILCSSRRQHKFARDSPLEEAGFEPSVLRTEGFERDSCRLCLIRRQRKGDANGEPMPRLRRGLPRDRWFASSSLQPNLSRIISRHGWSAPPPADGRLPREPAASARRSVG